MKKSGVQDSDLEALSLLALARRIAERGDRGDRQALHAFHERRSVCCGGSRTWLRLTEYLGFLREQALGEQGGPGLGLPEAIIYFALGYLFALIGKGLLEENGSQRHRSGRS